jgi:hypothetical protein
MCGREITGIDPGFRRAAAQDQQQQSDRQQGGQDGDEAAAAAETSHWLARWDGAAAGAIGIRAFGTGTAKFFQAGAMPAIALAPRSAFSRRAAVSAAIRPKRARSALAGMPANPRLVGAVVVALLEAENLEQAPHF